MEKIQVGECVRTKDGKIGKIYNYSCGTYKTKLFGASSGEIAKHSPNLIDLIEVGDIIKTKHPAFEKFYYEHIWNKEYLEHTVAFLKEKSLIIKSIVTHEQFAQIEYKVEE